MKMIKQNTFSKKEIGKIIKKNRIQLGLTQDKLAKMTGLRRTAITQIEAGRRDINSSELSIFTGILDISLDELLFKPNIKHDHENNNYGEPEFNKSKFIKLFLYILENCGSRINVGKTVIYKLFYFMDFDFYELYEDYLTGEIYRKIQHGPAPCHFSEIEEELINNKMIKKDVIEHHYYNQTKYMPLIQADMSSFSGKELKLIDNEIRKLSSMNAKQIEDYSHQDVPWIITKDREIINYDTVFYRKDMHSVRED
jgi:transcriptional regulator with XRE-family HTH domain